MHRTLAAMMTSLFAAWALATPVQARDIRVPAETRVYVTLSEELIGKKKQLQVGQIVPATVWRDVVVGESLVLRAGESVLVKVDELRTAKVAGIRGSVSLGAYETTAVDGRTIQLGGGYMKKGKGRIALSAALAGLVFVPLIFIKGSAAKLPAGTIFDAYTDQEVQVTVNESDRPRAIDLAGVVSGLDVTVLYDELEKQDKPRVFDFEIRAPSAAPSAFVIDRINDDATEPIPLAVLTREELEDEAVVRAQVPIKVLAKRFTKGINRFDISCEVAGERVSSEVVLDVQF